MAQTRLLIPAIPINNIQSKVLKGISNSGLKQFLTTTQWSFPQKDAMYTFEKVCLDPTLAEAFQEKFSQELKKNETREFMDQELEALTETVLRIKQDFEQVSGNLLRLDERNIKNKQAGWSGVNRMMPPIPLHQEWKKFQKEQQKRPFIRSYVRLIVLTKSFTSLTYRKGYRKVILEMAANSSISKDDVLTELHDFIEVIERLRSEGAQLSDNFDGLRSEIGNFKSLMQITIGDSIENDDPEIQDVEGKIQGVQAELAKYQAMATAGWVSLGKAVTTGAGIGMATGLGLAAMTPVGYILAVIEAAHAALGGLISGIVNEVKKKKFQYQLSQLHKRLDILKNQQKDINALKTLFAKTEGQVTDICNSINTIARIWAILKLEANTLKSALDDSTIARTKPGLIAQIKLAQAQCEVLEAHLQTYATKMATVDTDYQALIQY
ncbi:hypothetical protein GYMLUDRAFT_60600 [Collybiopsis luxurians FD-317 M1]|uniref:Uncharacterized protein n=1 Tax=Collybiopsis luxurians FD-317 M1 TaxID=944289 RepID=A0A0D0BT74_9AGAR|nr:hypothetical protein GYMLUDRAFT_60600 [Collybiopsis luxurians FD-317 M1]